MLSHFLFPTSKIFVIYLQIIRHLVLIVIVWVCPWWHQRLRRHRAPLCNVNVSYWDAEGGHYQGRGIQTIIIFPTAEGISQTLPPSLCHQPCLWMPKWPHDGLSLRVFPLRAAGNIVSCNCFRVAAMEAEQQNTWSMSKSLRNGDVMIFIYLLFFCASF